MEMAVIGVNGFNLEKKRTVKETLMVERQNGKQQKLVVIHQQGRKEKQT